MNPVKAAALGLFGLGLLIASIMAVLVTANASEPPPQWRADLEEKLPEELPIDLTLVVRSDGSQFALAEPVSRKSDILGLLEALADEPKDDRLNEPQQSELLTDCVIGTGWWTPYAGLPRIVRYGSIFICSGAPVPMSATDIFVEYDPPFGVPQQIDSHGPHQSFGTYWDHEKQFTHFTEYQLTYCASGWGQIFSPPQNWSTGPACSGGLN